MLLTRNIGPSGRTAQVINAPKLTRRLDLTYEPDRKLAKDLINHFFSSGNPLIRASNIGQNEWRGMLSWYKNELSQVSLIEQVGINGELQSNQC